MRILKSLALTCMVCVLSISLFACGAVSSNKVYTDYEQLSTNQKMFTEGRLDVNIDVEIMDTINSVDWSQNTDNKELFTKLTDVYEPVLAISMDFFNNNKMFLTSEQSNIKSQDSTKLKSLLDTLEKSISECENAVSALEYYKTLFTDGTQNFLQSSIVQNKLEVLYIKYDKLIEDAFAFNNYFIKVYTEKYPLIDFKDANVELVASDIKAVYNFTVANILDVAFKLKNHTNTVYTEAINTVLAIENVYNENSEEENFLSVTHKNNGEPSDDITNTKYIQMLDTLRNLQTQLEIYNIQKDNFFYAFDKLNSNISDDDKTVYQNVIDEFFTSSYTNVLSYLGDLVDLLVIVA